MTNRRQSGRCLRILPWSPLCLAASIQPTLKGLKFNKRKEIKCTKWIASGKTDYRGGRSQINSALIPITDNEW